MSVFGVDPSVKRLGLARPDGRTTSVIPRAGSKDPYRRLSQIVEAVALELRRFPEATLVVVEGYSLGSPGRLSLVRLGEIGGAIRLLAWERDLTVVEVSPSSLKEVATGRGGASKDEVLAAAVEAGATPANHDEADAWWLSEIGRRALAGAPLPDTVAALGWPTRKEPRS